MLKIYLKQAWELLKQNKLFSSLYIAGTGLAIAMTMIMAVIYYVKLAPVYPEVNRMNTYYLNSARFTKDVDGQKNSSQWALSYKALQEWIYPLKNVEAVSAALYGVGQYYIQPADRSGDFKISVILTDTGFFRIYPFRFLEGTSFTEADLKSGIWTAVITDEMAHRLFGTSEGVVGRTFSLNYTNVRVCGIVNSASYLTSQSWAQVYLPYSTSDNYKKSEGDFPYLGGYNITFLTRDEAQGEALRTEIKDIVRKTNIIHKSEWELDIWEQPTSHLLSVFQSSANQPVGAWITVLLLTLLVLLLVPALNLSGMIASRMEGRLAEMGIRKSFGAGRRILLSQVMWENLLLTLLGGVVGLFIAWLMLYVCRDWVFSILDSWSTPIPEGVEVYVSGEMLFAPAVFLAALLLCVTLNLLSALLPAWFSLRKPITYSLNEKR